MLDFMRERAKTWFAWVIFVIVVIPFALFGISQYSDTKSNVNVAVVNDKEISVDEFQRAYQQQRNRIQSMLGKNFDPALIDDQQLKNNVLESLIDREALIQAAHDAGLRVSDELVGAEIRAIPNLQTNGQFDKELYTRLLRAQGMSMGAFEHLMSNDLVVQQLQHGIAETGFATKNDIDALLRMQLQQRDIGYVIVPVSAYIGGATVEEQAVAQYYEKNQDRFRTPEQVSVDYLELSVDDLAKGVQVTDDALHERYQERAADFATPEERRARHILIQVASDAPQAAVEAAKKKTEELLARVRKGESFADLAKQFSQDPGSAKEGGDLGFFGRGVMDKAFEQAAFALKIGEVSEPVRSTFGFHIIKLESVRGGERKPFEQVRADLERDVRHQQAEDQFFSQAETLSNMAFEHADNLSSASESLHLPVQSTGLFTRDAGGGIAVNPKVRAAAFSDEVLMGGKNSEAVELTPDHIVVLHLKEHKPAAVRSLDEVREEIRQELRIEFAKTKAKEVGEDLVRRIKAGEEAVAAAAQLKLKWERLGFVTRQDAKGNPEITAAAFHLGPAVDAKPVFDGKSLRSGDFAAYGLYAIKEGDPAHADEKTVQSLKSSLTREYGQVIFKDYMDALKADMKITRHPDKL